MNKKKILFVLDSLRIGGAEKSLITLLSLLDYERFDVDLHLSPAQENSFHMFLERSIYFLLLLGNNI